MGALMNEFGWRRSAAWFGWGVVAFFALLMGLISLRLLSFDPNTVPQELRQNFLDRPVLFYAHALVAPIALIVGVWQFLPVTRRSAYHRWAGRFYVACAAVASVAGLIIAFTTDTGPVVGIGFGILAVLWFSVTARAYLLARSGNFVRHRIWMIRSYALCCAGITLRIILPVGIATGFGFRPSYIVAAWGSWIINLLIAEWIIRRMNFQEVTPHRPPRREIAPAPAAGSI
jgi:uncharacterized membrane protein